MTVLPSSSCTATATRCAAPGPGNPRIRRRGEPVLRAARSAALLVVLAVALSALGVGCSDNAESNADVEGAEPSGIGKEVTMPIAAAVPAVVDAGAEPRTRLRPGYQPGTTQQVTLRTDHHIEQQINDQAVRDFSPPAVSIPLSAQADNNGIELTIGTVTSPDPSLAKALLPAGGSHAGFDMSEFGAITALRLAPQPATSDAARAALEQAFYQAVYQSIAFPEEPVGEGAVWTVRQQVSGGVPLDQVTTAMLTHCDGVRCTIELNIIQTPESTLWNLPNDAGQLDIIDYVMHGSGTITVDLGLPLPVSGSITVGGMQTFRDPRSAVLLRQTLSTQVQWDE